MEACSEEEEIPREDSRITDLVTLRSRSLENSSIEINSKDILDEEESYNASSIYIKNWQVKVFPLQADDPWRKIVKSCDYWIALAGSAADKSGNILENEILTVSAWVARVLTENCIQTVDGSIYTLLGSMDIISTSFSGRARVAILI